MFSRIKIDKLTAMPKLKQEIIGHLFDFLKFKLNERWYKYNGTFKYEGKEYDIECECRMDNQMFSMRDMHIQHKQQVIEVDDLIERGLIQ